MFRSSTNKASFAATEATELEFCASPVSAISADLSCSIDIQEGGKSKLHHTIEDCAQQPISTHSIVESNNNIFSNSQLDSIEDMDNSSQKERAVSETATNLNRGGSIAADTLYDFDTEANGCGRCVESRGECCRRSSQATQLEMGLLYCSRERLKLKDFSSEIRAAMDVEQFVHQAELLLDMTQVSVEDIVETMLERVLSRDQKNDSKKLSEARKVLFISGSAMLMTRTIQGVSCALEFGQPSNSSTILDYDQSWLCALCNLAQINRRHMIVARFKQQVNMGDNAHDVRLFMLIVTPSNEKGTKQALETGRTFATMLADVGFRQKLLEARNATEFKTHMMLRAQQLSKAKALKNRHKYQLDAVLHSSISSLSNSKQDLSQTSICTTRQALDHLKQTKKGPKGALSKLNQDSNNNRSQITTDESSTISTRLFERNPHSSKLFELMAQSASPLNSPKAVAFDGSTIGDNLKLDGKREKATKEKIGEKGTWWCNLAAICKHLEFGRGFCNDFERRIRYYPSDFIDAVVGPPKTVQKTIATIWFLYFGILLPTIAFSALNTTQTHGHMGDLRKAIIGQAIGGLCFALFGGQPLVIIMTTAPLCLYTKVIHQMCIDYGFHFPAMYAAVGLWNGIFLAIYSLFGFSKLMKWCTRSTEEIFALFIVIAFITDASKDLIKNFNKYYYTPACQATLNQTYMLANSLSAMPQINSLNQTLASSLAEPTVVCRRETSLLFILLMLGTLWLATTLYRFNKTPYLEAGKRELLADYALPTSVIAMSFFGSYVFDDIYVEKFPLLKGIQFERAQIEMLPPAGIFTSLGLGFTLSLLFFMDQNISAAMVNSPQNRLKKGCAYHFDLLIVAILNGFLTLYGLPMMHGVLPHSPLHVRSLADIEERVEEGHVREVIINVRETRVTGIASHILLLCSLLLIPYPIAYIPTAVLNGLFLYMAMTSLDGLQMFERILLLFTEQSKYPPNHYIRRCPQRKIHKFTMLQLLQLLVMCLFGFSPINIIEMFFPIIILLMIPFRHKVIPKFIDDKYLDALDGQH